MYLIENFEPQFILTFVKLLSDDTLLEDDVEEHDFNFDNEKEDALLAETEFDTFVDEPAVSIIFSSLFFLSFFLHYWRIVIDNQEKIFTNTVKTSLKKNLCNAFSRLTKCILFLKQYDFKPHINIHIISQFWILNSH